MAFHLKPSEGFIFKQIWLKLILNDHLAELLSSDAGFPHFSETFKFKIF